MASRNLPESRVPPGGARTAKVKAVREAVLLFSRNSARVRFGRQRAPVPAQPLAENTDERW